MKFKKIENSLRLLHLLILLTKSIPDYFEGEIDQKDSDSSFNWDQYKQIKTETERKVKEIINKSKIQAMADLKNYMTSIDFHK